MLEQYKGQTVTLWFQAEGSMVRISNELEWSNDRNQWFVRGQGSDTFFDASQVANVHVYDKIEIFLK